MVCGQKDKHDITIHLSTYNSGKRPSIEMGLKWIVIWAEFLHESTMNLVGTVAHELTGGSSIVSGARGQRTTMRSREFDQFFFFVAFLVSFN